MESPHKWHDPIVSPPITKGEAHATPSLREQLISAQVVLDFDSRPFVPFGKLRELVFNCDFQKEIAGYDVDDMAELQDFFTEKAPRIFAILTLSRLTAKLHDFKGNKFSDKQLPIQYDISKNRIAGSDRLSPVHRAVFESWTSVEIDDFCQNQWRCNVPVEDMLDTYWWPAQTVFPFEHSSSSKGTSFSRVSKIRVQNGHVTSVAWSGHLALKESSLNVNQIRQSATTKEAYLQELESLRKTSFDPMIMMQDMSSDKSQRAFSGGNWSLLFKRHLIKLLAAFQRDQTTYLLFHWAEKGTLYDLWHGERPPRLPLSWIATQVTGLIGAIHLLHSCNCRHGDLKPDNILVFGPNSPVVKSEETNLEGEVTQFRIYDFDDVYLCPFFLGCSEEQTIEDDGIGTLVIADFGLARVHEVGTKLRNEPTVTMSGFQRYEPPEANKNHPHHRNPASRRYDVWSLGCILLEFIIWVCFGTKELESFNQNLGNRRTEKFWKFSPDTDSYEVDPEVVRWIGLIKRALIARKNVGENGPAQKESYPPDAEVTNYLLDMLETVEYLMLVIELGEKELDVPLLQNSSPLTIAAISGVQGNAYPEAKETAGTSKAQEDVIVHLAEEGCRATSEQLLLGICQIANSEKVSHHIKSAHDRYLEKVRIGRQKATQNAAKSRAET